MEQYAAASYCQYNDEHPAGEQPLNCQNRKGKLGSKARNIFNDIDVCPWLENQPDRVTTYEFLKSVTCYELLVLMSDTWNVL